MALPSKWPTVWPRQWDTEMPGTGTRGILSMTLSLASWFYRKCLKQTGIVHIITGFTHFDGLDIDKISRSIVDGRKMAYQVADVYRKYLPGFGKSFVAGVAANLGVRSSADANSGTKLFSAMLLPVNISNHTALAM